MRQMMSCQPALSPSTFCNQVGRIMIDEQLKNDWQSRVNIRYNLCMVNF